MSKNSPQPDATRGRAARRSPAIVGATIFVASVAWLSTAGCQKSQDDAPITTTPASPETARDAAPAPEPPFPPTSAFPASAGAFADFNLLLVTLDTTRADHLACYGADGIETPTLDHLAGEGVIFARAAAAAPTTLPAHSSILTGLYPVHHGARVNGVFRLADSHHTIAEVLKDRGYRTAAFVSAFVLDAQFGVAQGFDLYDDDLADDAKRARNQYEERAGDVTTERALRWLRDAAAERFFCWVHYFDAHAPYEPPREYAARYANNLYDGEIAFVDECLGRLIAALDKLGVSDRTLIVVVGDHGEGLGEHDELVHGYLTYESTMRVPLVMRCGSALGDGVRFDRWVSQVDIFPTVLSLLGVDPPGQVDGFDLTNSLPNDRPVFGETLHGMVEFGWAPLAVVYADRLKYIESPAPELFDLTRDPWERNNLATSMPETALQMRQRLTALFGADLALTENATPNVDPGAAALEKLAALGYVATPGEIPEAESRPDPKQMIRYAQKAFNRVMAADDPALPLKTRIRGLEQAAKAYPDFVLAWKRLARAYRQAGDVQGAAEALEHCVELRPDAPDALFDLALVKAHQDKTDDAVALLQQVVSKYPGHVAAQYLLGVIHRHLQRRAEAADCFLAAFKQDSGYKRCADFLVTSFEEAGRGDETPALLQQALADNPRASAARVAYARFLSAAQQHRDAEKLLRDGAALAPDDGTVVTSLAMLLLKCPDATIRNPAESTKLLEQYCGQAGDLDHHAWLTLAIVHEHNGRTADALSTAKHARELAQGERDAETLEAANRLINRLDNRERGNRERGEATTPNPTPTP